MGAKCCTATPLLHKRRDAENYTRRSASQELEQLIRNQQIFERDAMKCRWCQKTNTEADPNGTATGRQRSMGVSNAVVSNIATVRKLEWTLKKWRSVNSSSNGSCSNRSRHGNSTKATGRLPCLQLQV
ncbi:hypothetical protein OSTOST_07726 [Ostertagia ostertagi]